MACYQDYCYAQRKLIPTAFADQIPPGTFEYTLRDLIDNELAPAVLEARYCNDETGRPAYDPALLPKIVLYAYARGIVSSRRIAQLCRVSVWQVPPLRPRCLKHPERAPGRQGAFFSGETRRPESFTAKVKRKLDLLLGQTIHLRQMATGEPVFGHLRTLGLDRFTLRGRPKVDAQWKLYWIVHNLIKVHRYGVDFA